MKELSNLLGLSQTTISRALNGYPEVAEPTRLRVMQAASAAGYRPSQHARRLAGGRADAVGLIWSPDPEQSDHGLETVLLRSLVTAGSVYGLHFVLIVSGRDGGLREARKLSLRGMIDAALLLNPQDLPVPGDWPVPIACVGRRPVLGTELLWVDIDHEQTAYAAAKFLFQIGHRRLVLVDDKSDRMQLYLAGARRALAHFGATRNASFSIELEPARRNWDAATHEQPTCFFCPNNALAREVEMHASKHRMSIGEDVSIIAYDESGKMSAEMANHSLTVCRPNIEVLARRTLEAVRSLIEPGGAASIDPLIQSELVVGLSTGAMRVC
nr:LacI family DNA-binding transcriptional regulator [Rhizobium esperanzae]